MHKYYTRPCNFYYGRQSLLKIKKKKALPLNGNKFISFDKIEIISRKKTRKICIKKINFQNKLIKSKIKKDLKLIIKKKKFKKLSFINFPLLMGIINLTPDSFSDGNKFNSEKKALDRAKFLIKKGCEILDIGGESTRPGAKAIKKELEWKRIGKILSKIKKLNIFVSLDTRKSGVMERGIKQKVNLINDVSGFKYDKNTINILKKTNIPFIIHHMKGSPETMQKNPKYKNVLLDIFDYFEKTINQLRSKGIIHNNIILDPGIGFGKNLKHNITILNNISIFHSLGFPVMLGTSRKRFIKDLSKENDSEDRLGGTISSSLHAMMQGVQILRVHDVNEVRQSIKVFKSLNFK